MSVTIDFKDLEGKDIYTDDGEKWEPLELEDDIYEALLERSKEQGVTFEEYFVSVIADAVKEDDIS